MKNLMKKMFFATMLTMVAFLAGCGSKEENTAEVTHAVLVLQACENVPMVNLEAAEAMFRQVCSVEGSTVEVIVADGEPWRVETEKLERVDPNFSKTMQKIIIEENVQVLMSGISAAMAVHPESDLRGAIEMGARQLESYEDGKKELIIFGSGLNTVAPLTMQEMQLADMDVNVVVENLMNASYGIDLADVAVTVYNFGDVAGKQEPISNKDRENLESFWTSYLEKGNPKSLVFKKELPSELVYEGLPPMSTVPTGQAEDVMAKLDRVESVTFDEATIAFEKGTATLVNPEEARKAIKDVAAYMKNNDMEAYLVGGTAKWGAIEDSLQLSFERSLAIKQLFLEEGVEEEQLTVIGTGWFGPFYMDDQLPDGTLNENIAPQNRACTWVKASGTLANSVLEDEDFSKFILE